MLKSLLAKATLVIRHPSVLASSAADRRLAFLNSPDRLDKFKKKSNRYVQRRKKNEIQVPFNSHLPYVLDGDKSSNDFYGNPPLLNYANYVFPKELEVEINPPPNFSVSADDSRPISPEGRILIENRTCGLTRNNIEFLMGTCLYVILRSQDEQRNNEVVEKKYWYPKGGHVLDAILTARKLYEFICFDPLNPVDALRKVKLPATLPKNTKKRKAIINQRYYRLARAKGMFVLFGVSKYNVNKLRQFLLEQIADFDHCYDLGYTEHGYTATYLIPVAFFSKNEENFSENDIVKFYTKPNNEIQRNVDPEYARYQSIVSSEALPNYNKLEIPEKTPENENFLTNLSFSLKKSENDIKEYYLSVSFMSEAEEHLTKNDSPDCNKKGWYYRPDVYGKLVTIIAKEKKDLNVEQTKWVEERMNRKGEKIK